MLLAGWPLLPASAAADTTPPDPFDIVADVGEFQTGYDVAAPYNNIYITWATTEDDESAVTYRVTVDGEVVRTVTDVAAYTTVTKRIDVPDGSHTVAVTASDAADNIRLSTHTLAVIVDKISPVFTTTPKVRLRKGSVTPEGYPMRYTWTAVDEGTGLVEARIGPNDECCYTVSPNLKHFDFTVEPRSSKTWRIRVFDGVGRIARAPRSAYVAPVPWSHTRHSTNWQQRQDSSALDGSEWVSKKAGDRVRLTTDGRSIGWVATTGPTRGRAEVYVNKRLVARVNLYSAQRRYGQVVWTRSQSAGETVTITIVNRSPRDRPLIGVDAFLRQS